MTQEPKNKKSTKRKTLNIDVIMRNSKLLISFYFDFFLTFKKDFFLLAHNIKNMRINLLRKDNLMYNQKPEVKFFGEEY